MINTYKTLDTEEYKYDDDYQDKYFYIRKKYINENQRNNENKLVFKDNLTCVDIDFGEAVAYQIGKRTIGNICKAELMKKSRLSFNSEKFSYGVASYYSFSKNDEMVISSWFIRKYLEFQNKSLDNLQRRVVSIDDSLQAIKYQMVILDNRPITEYLKVKQQFIDMIMFDCKFGNYDRNTENWMLIKDKTTGVYDLYPLFDNEAILGFDRNIDDFRISSKDKQGLTKQQVMMQEKKLIVDYNKTLKLKSSVPNDELKGGSTVKDVLKYVSNKYPEQAKNSVKALLKFSYRDFAELLDTFPELSEERKQLVKKMFISFELTFIITINKYLSDKTEEQELIHKYDCA